MNEINQRKHGIDFIDVPSMFDFPMVVFLDQRQRYGEDRWIGIGWLGDILAVVVFIEYDTSMVRIISARKATRNERQIYREEIGH